MSTTEEKRPTFADFIVDHAHGSANDEITAAMADVVQAVQHLDRKGKVVIELLVEPAGSGTRTVATAVKCMPKPPEPDPEASIFYPDESGTLFRTDPAYASRIGDDTDQETQL